ncbi:MAG: hypothetical protein UT41_C0001G0301 [Candidatus Wolfebacteria bacterium GW2011_GWC2_39_22]|uniref:Uncharacterized protein n=2 Tax=Candidatus Wolfeibacteriota TaxID=1752735 RepID=A0A0G1HB02_9BACT|nr:MAG: hypothetical protein UT41_C0001G0301 [Candidatus Wolfebacteria bacterium GW2011_GWC2_39_22]KKT43688.1 MAG: hypothetical protein UW32_C0001G0280 [Candidatus Wolfebacteria bacterium GW2011_GWE2_44_13]
MPRKKMPLYTNVLELMRKKAAQVYSSHQAQKELIELGELLQESSDLSSQSEAIIVRTLLEIADTLSSEGDARNSRAYLVTLSDAFRRA